jgi:hypothetical protein
MKFRSRFSAAATVTILFFHFTTAPCQAADRNRFFDSGQSRELINQPMCWSAEQPNEPSDCDFAHRT